MKREGVFEFIDDPQGHSSRSEETETHTAYEKENTVFVFLSLGYYFYVLSFLSIFSQML